jgi:hypothetical protein
MAALGYPQPTPSASLMAAFQVMVGGLARQPRNRFTP